MLYEWQTTTWMEETTFQRLLGDFCPPIGGKVDIPKGPKVH